MARDAIAITTVARTGTAPASPVLGVVANGLELPATVDVLTWVEIENRSGAAKNVTFLTDQSLDGFGLEDLPVSVPAWTAATLTTALAGVNNDLVFTSLLAGKGGHEITVTYVVAGLSTALSIAVVGTDITVNVATDAAGAATSTAAQVETALEANVDVAALVSVANAAANDGTGVVAAMSQTALSGGADGVKLVKLATALYGVSSFIQDADGKIYISVADDSALYFRAFTLA